MDSSYGDVIANQPVMIDNGSGIIKAGFAGDQTPKCRFPNYVGRPKHVRVMAGALEGDMFIGDKEKIELESEAKCGVWFMPKDEYVAADKGAETCRSTVPSCIETCRRCFYRFSVVWSKHGEPSIMPPTERRNEQKIKEAKELYGDSAEKIYATEVLMRMKFDQEFDKSKPALWPNIPFNL